MGVGDALIAAGRARKLYQETKQPVLIVGRHNVRYWSDLWNDVPYIIRRPAGRRYQTLVDGSGVRAYIAAKTPERWTWRPFTPTPAEIVFTPAELAFAERWRGSVMVEPRVKANTHRNKAWLPERWLQFMYEIHGPWGTDAQTVMCIPRESDRVPRMTWPVAITPTFRQACAVLSVCRAFVGTEGGLMHAAAAVGTPAVILWSEFISPDITGYAQHRNLRHAGPACGMRTDCPGCRASMEAITVEEVVQNLQEILK